MMTTEEQLKLAEKKIEEIKDKIKRTEQDLNEAERKKRYSQTDKHIGLAMMTNSTMRPVGTYKFLSGSGEESRMMSEISDLESKLSSLKRDLDKAERELRDVKSKYEYEQRKEAKLIVDDNGIFIEGDESRRDIVKPLADKVVAYVQDYESYASSPEVAEYLKLKKELNEVVKKSALPEAIRENLSEIKSAQNRTGAAFEYMVIDDKILVDRDFASENIKYFERDIEDYNRGISRVDAKREEFEPTLLGKIFKSVGKKQKAKNDLQIDRKINELISYRGYKELGLTAFQGYKEKYIVPATEAIEILRKIKRLTITSSNVSRFIKKGEDAKKHIEEKTILEALNVDAGQVVLSEIKGYLDSRGLKLSKETIFEAICHSDTYRWLAEQVRATGFKPSEQIKQTGIQPGE